MAKIYKEIQELGEIITGKTPSTADETYWGGKIPFITPTDINGFTTYYQESTERYVSPIGAAKQKKTLLPPNAVCVTCIASIGKPCITKVASITNQQINSIVANENNDYRYVYYLMRYNLPYMLTVAGGSGSGTPIISKNKFARFKFLVEDDLCTQRAIAKRLSAYDNLIENNRRRIAILERKAEQLYKEWFVRRRKSVEKASKESWCNYSIKELCHINHDTISAKASGSILYLDTSSITGNKIATLESYDLRSAPGRARRKVKRNSIVYSIVRPNLKHHGIIKDAPANLIVSTGFAVLDAKHDIANVIYLFLSSQEVVDYCQMIAEGAVATYPSIRPEDIGKLKMALPSIAEAEKWNRELEPLFTLASNLQRQNALLVKERDLLLPRLMSGRLKP